MCSATYIYFVHVVLALHMASWPYRPAHAQLSWLYKWVYILITCMTLHISPLVLQHVTLMNWEWPGYEGRYIALKGTSHTNFQKYLVYANGKSLSFPKTITSMISGSNTKLNVVLCQKCHLDQ